MRYIKTFDEVRMNDIEKIDEGLREFVIGALALLSVSGGVKAQRVNNDTVVNKEVSKKIDSLNLNFGNEFSSGDHRFSKGKSDSIEDKLNQIANFIKTNPSNNIKIFIESSESKVPNVDVETKKRLKVGELSKLRETETKNLISIYLDSLSKKGLFKGDFKIDTASHIGKTTYKIGEDPHQDKFTKEQYVNVTVTMVDSSNNKPVTKSQDSTNSDYSKFYQRVFDKNGKAFGDIFMKSSESNDIKNKGNVNTGKQNILLKTLNSDSEYARTGNMYDGKTYLIPWEWWNNQTTKKTLPSNMISDILSKNFPEVK